MVLVFIEVGEAVGAVVYEVVVAVLIAKWPFMLECTAFAIIAERSGASSFCRCPVSHAGSSRVQIKAFLDCVVVARAASGGRFQ